MGTLLNRRRYYMGGGSSLPYDAEVEYLENNAPGGAYIDTGFKPNQNSAIDITVSIIADGITSRFFEVRYAVWNAEYAIINFGQRDNQLQARFGTGMGGIKIRDKLLPDNVYKLSIRDYKFYVDDVFVMDLPARTFQCTDNLCLFALNNNGSISAGTDQYSRIHACSIYDNGTLFRDYISVRKDSIGYLYDKVSHRLFGNNGTNVLNFGPDKNL